MKYKVIANVLGESKPRQLFAPDRLQSGQCASLILRSVPAGTEVMIYELIEMLVQKFVKTETTEVTDDKQSTRNAANATRDKLGGDRGGT